MPLLASLFSAFWFAVYSTKWQSYRAALEPAELQPEQSAECPADFVADAAAECTTVLPAYRTAERGANQSANTQTFWAAIMQSNSSADRDAFLPAISCTKPATVDAAVIATVDPAIESAVI
jgi:hypothetical protein